MAITLQLARLSDEYVARCASDSSLLDEVCSFRALPQADYVDLDWAPGFLDKAAVRSAIDPALARVLDMSTGGTRIVNPDYNGTWGAPMYWNSSETRDISAGLDLIDSRTLLDHDVVGGVNSEYRARDPDAYIASQFRALRDFYRDAATRGLSIMLWDD